MIVTIEGKKVDVYDARCAKRACFRLGLDRGPFVAGRGYTNTGNYKPRYVCMQRHLHGCPTVSVCPVCHGCTSDAPGKCPSRDCSGITAEATE